MKGNSENTWNEMIYAQNGKKKKKVEISLKSREKHTHLDSKPIFEKKKVYKWRQGESDGFISKGYASRWVTNSSERHTARSSISRAARDWTQELVRPDASHKKMIFSEKIQKIIFPKDSFKHACIKN